MKKIKFGTPAMGFAMGGLLVAAAVLIMVIGFWRTLLLVGLFAVGYLFGSVDNMGNFIREKADKIIPNKDKTAQPINIKEEIAREQEAEAISGRGPVFTYEDVADEPAAVNNKSTEE